MDVQTTPTRKNIPLHQHVRDAEKVARRNGGKLPRHRDLKSKHPRLVTAMHMHPAQFAHIPRLTAIDEHVARAEAIAKANNGFLPACTDLMAIDKKLTAATFAHPERFAHIPQAWPKRRQEQVAQYVAQAEELAEINGGFIEITANFQEAHNALTCCIRRNPEAFAHIPRKRRKMRTAAQQVKAAERYAAMNEGKLIASGILRKADPALFQNKKHHPERFAHIPQVPSRPRKSAAFYVAFAEKTAKENGGAIPYYEALRKKGGDYANLAHYIYMRPEHFQHLQQEVRFGPTSRVERRTPPLRNSAAKKGSR